MIKNPPPLVTIAIPTYNRADGYLRQALESALNQTYPHIEVIVSDNCSMDNTEMVVRGYSDVRLRYFKHAKNIGPNPNFNFCLAQAKGDYFLLLHDDDMIDSDFVDVCMKAANYQTDIGIIRTGNRIIDSHGTVFKESPNRVAGLSTEEFFRGWFAGRTSWYLVSTLFNTKRLKEIGGLRSKHQLAEDEMAIAELASRFGRADVETVKASFRKHPGELTFSTKVIEWGEDFLQVLDLLCKLVPEDKALLIRREGMRFFSMLSYNRVAAIKSRRQRLKAYIDIFRLFNYRYPPPSRLLLTKFGYRALQRTRRKAKQLLSYG